MSLFAFQVVNYDDVRQAIVERLEMLRDSPQREESPIIYHLDVGAMYPNIILTNRLQPSAMVSQHDCAACDFNRADNHCQRPMEWIWRGEYSPSGLKEYQSIRRQLSYERHPKIVTERRDGRLIRYTKEVAFSELMEKEQAKKVSARLKSYSSNAYKKTKVTEEEQRVNTVCMRENSFYVNTVRAFRDRRYDYKLLTKQWKGKKVRATIAVDCVHLCMYVCECVYADEGDVCICFIQFTVQVVPIQSFHGGSHIDCTCPCYPRLTS